MSDKKNTFQNWVDLKYPFGTRKKLADEAGVRQDILSRDYRRLNGLEMVSKYAKLTGEKSVDLQGWEYGMYIELKNVKIV